LAVLKPKLKSSIIGVFIANEENSSEAGIGIDELEKRGELVRLKNGPLYWVDSADIGPTMGTGGVIVWELTATGKLFHSGFPQKAINALELAMDTVTHLQTRFHKDFPYSDKEKEYGFEIPSSMKPTQIRMPPGSTNQIPGECVVTGDIRVTPFHTIDHVKAKIEQYVAELDVVAVLPKHGCGGYELKDENKKGTVELKWLGHPYKGVACNLKSIGYKALYTAIETVTGKAKPFSLTGSLPIIADLQASGYDVQVVGFGKMDAYHAVDEYGKLSEFAIGTRVCAHILDALEEA